MPIGNGVVLIGMGERTSRQAIGQLALSLFKHKAVDKVLLPALPQIPRGDAPGHGVQFLRPGCGDHLPGSGEPDRRLHPAP